MDRFEIPEDIAALTDEELASGLDAAYSEAATYAESDGLTESDVDRMESLAGFVTAAEEARTERARLASEKVERIEAARAALTRPDGAEAAVEETETAAAEAEESEGEGEDASTATAATEDSTDAPADSEGETSEQEEAVVADGRSAVDRARENSEHPNVPATPSVAITAGAEVPSLALGQKIDGMASLGDAFMSKFRAMSPGGMRKGTRQRYNVAKMALPRTDGLVADNIDGQEVFKKASDERRLDGGSLTASRAKNGPANALVAAGWCAPSETLYDLCSVVTADGLYSLPEVQVNRGGIRYTQGPDLSGINIADIGFLQTEAQAEAGEEKACLEIPCADFTEVRLDATGICVKAGLLQVSAYPELVREWMDTYLTLYQHRYSLDTLTRVQTLLGAPVGITGVWDNAFSILHAIELVAAGYRQDTLMGLDETMEVVLPHWVLPALRADLANRNGRPSVSVTDAELLAAFAERNISPQFVRHYQDLDTTAGIATTYPSEIEFMMYPAGSYVRGTTDVISLDAVYDSVGLSTNTYTALFAETGLLVAEMCTKGKRVTMPLSVTGNTAAADISAHFTSGS